MYTEYIRLRTVKATHSEYVKTIHVDDIFLGYEWNCPRCDAVISQPTGNVQKCDSCELKYRFFEDTDVQVENPLDVIRYFKIFTRHLGVGEILKGK